MAGRTPCISNTLSADGGGAFDMRSPTGVGHGHTQSVGEVQFSSPTYVCSEGDGHISLDVVRTKSYYGRITAKYTTQDLTAKKGHHYKHTAGTLTFEARALDADPFGAVGMVSHAVVTIEDDDLPGG
eukprot:gene50321-22403_t